MQDTIPTNGKFTLKIPVKYSPYIGMCRWLITNSAEGGGLDMAIPGHDFSVSCWSDNPTNESIIYKGFDAVNELNRLHSIQQVILYKFETMCRASDLYGKKHRLYKGFTKEKERQVKAYEQFQQDLQQNPNFNARFLPIVNLTQGILHRLTDDKEQKAMLFNEYITQKVSFEDMYVSGHWDEIIQSWVVFQINVVNDKNQFAHDFQLISNRIKNPVHYTDFTGKLTYYLSQNGKDDYIDAISKIVLSSGKVTEYLGSMQVYLNSMVGMMAPNIIFKNNGSLYDIQAERTLIIFWASWCPYCMEEITKVNAWAKEQLNIKVVAISLDDNNTEYEKAINELPNLIHHTDLKKWNGQAVKDYHVYATPTIFLLDNKREILLKPFSLEQLNEWLDLNLEQGNK